MKQKIEFTKMHGAGNDYIYVNTMLHPIDNPSELSELWSKFHFGIGSDGLVLIGAPKDAEQADFSMRIFNADGSEAMMCGNATRCIGKYVYEHGLTDKTTIRLETLSGIKVIQLRLSESNEVDSVVVDMGEPVLENMAQYVPVTDHVLQSHDRKFRGVFVSMGNPHFVIIDDANRGIDVEYYGSELEFDAAFPERCNIEFAFLQEDGSVRMRVWERGSGITMACGTGACATAVAVALQCAGKRHSKIVMDGGSLDIEWRADDNHVYMAGPATEVFQGTILI